MATYNPAPIPESDSSPRAQLDPANPTSQQNNNFGADANPAGQVQEQHTSAQGGSFQTGQDTFAAKGQHEQTGTDAAPPSTVADYDYPNVPESHETQQAASGPYAGGQENSNQVPFKEQVNGYAKKIAGTFFRNSEEKEFGEKKLRGEI